jgi:hypothetical protein
MRLIYKNRPGHSSVTKPSQTVFRIDARIPRNSRSSELSRIAMRITRAIAIWTLGFLGVTAIVGAVPLILFPQGDLLHMPLNLLEHSPFHSFLIPGIILLLANGVLSFVALYQLMRRRNGYGWWVAFQGCVISGWIVVEVIMIRAVAWPHFLYLAVGLILIASGLALAWKAEGQITKAEG